MSDKRRMFKPWVYTDVPKYLLIGAAIGIGWLLISNLLN
jgi:hypothetical protein